MLSLKKSLTIHWKYKYFDSTVQRAEDRRQKFYFRRLSFAVNVKLNLSIHSQREIEVVFLTLKNSRKKVAHRMKLRGISLEINWPQTGSKRNLLIQ